MAAPPGPRVLTFALENWPRNNGPSTRASKPKVRTGCVTCKRRRVKCDETRPACQNCLKRRVACEGYAIEPRSKPSPKTSSSSLSSSSSSSSPPRASPSPVSAGPNYQGVVFTSQLQKDHFDQWVFFAGDTLVFPSELLSETIPQLARSDAAVRNAAFAVGAASLGSTSREQRLLGKGPHYADALRYYNRSLRLTATSPVTQDTVPRVLVACLLFFAFEALQGDRRAALTHLNHGTHVLDQYERRVGRKRTPLLDAIVADFQRLTMQSWSHSGDHPAETDGRVPWCCRGRTRRYAVDELPHDAFGSLDEAHRWWEVTRHHVVHHAPLLIGFRVEGAGSSKGTSFPASQSLPISAEQVKGCMRFVDRWRRGFLPLAERFQRGGGCEDREYLKALGLRIQSLYLSVPIGTANYTDQEALARMTPVVREYVDLSEEFLELQRRLSDKAGEVFTMDSNSPTWALGAASMICADDGVRADATRLLRSYPRRDGLWDTHTYVAMLDQYLSMKRAIEERLGPEKDPQHVFDYEVVYEDKSLSWVKAVEDPTAVERDALEYKIQLP
ncbi:Aspercryptin biosynthesis cluster-specific transcription regulator atnN [Colletotrichum trifolii]|uniref:Aspercryptin biosynthesis cluster-specific transcription regulator atnN n=1 Tax=Colletotrichum trifolii TaxID=5466 RepID=A0A4R8RRA7_COLTR|nr:Aspercryptin biosynthesis cluster-specific transcription regulator atnN [Colletotrichum trifolii]